MVYHSHFVQSTPSNISYINVTAKMNEHDTAKAVISVIKKSSFVSKSVYLITESSVYGSSIVFR